jgi:hypothetical protein
VTRSKIGKEKRKFYSTKHVKGISGGPKTQRNHYFETRKHFNALIISKKYVSFWIDDVRSLSSFVRVPKFIVDWILA